MVYGSVRGCEESELLKVVPGRTVDPSELGFIGLGADETGRVGNAESADGSDIGEEGVVDGGRNKS